MSTRCARILVCVFLPVAVVLPAQAQELRVQPVLEPTQPGVALPAVIATSSDLALKPAGPGQWTYSVATSQRVLGTATMSLNATPAQYHSLPVVVRLPFASKEPSTVSLYGVVVNNTSKRVTELHGMAIGGAGGEMRHKEYFRLHQEAALMSEQRLAELRTGTGKLGVFNAQLFYKYLELARQLGRDNNLVPSSGVLQVRAYMQTQLALPDGQVAVTAALGPNGVQKFKAMLTDIDFVEAEHLRKVWAYIKENYAPFSREACDLYTAFVQTSVSPDFDQGLVSTWNLHKDYNVVSLATEAVRMCLAKDAARVAEPAASAAMAAAKVALIQAQAHPVAKTPDVARNIDGGMRILRKSFF